MSPKTITLVFIVCLVQGFHCKTVDQVLDEYKPKIRNLAEDVKHAYNATQKDYDGRRSEIREHVHQGMVRVDARIGTLVVEADASGNKNCALNLKVSLRGIHSTYLRNCHANDDLNYSQREINSFRELLRDTEDLPRRCKESVSADGAADDVKKCLDAGIKRNQESIRSTKRNVADGLKRALANSNACIDVTSKELNAKVDAVERNYRSCVRN